MTQQNPTHKLTLERVEVERLQTELHDMVIRLAELTNRSNDVIADAMHLCKRLRAVLQQTKPLDQPPHQPRTLHSVTAPILPLVLAPPPVTAVVWTLVTTRNTWLWVGWFVSLFFCAACLFGLVLIAWELWKARRTKNHRTRTTAQPQASPGEPPTPEAKEAPNHE